MSETGSTPSPAPASAEPWRKWMRRGALLVLGGWAVLALAVVVGVVAVVALLFDQQSERQEAVDQWMALIEQGKYETAYDEMCQRIRDERTVDAVVPLLGAAFDDLEHHELNVKNDNDGSHIKGTVTARGETRNVDTDLVKDDDTWRVCGIP